LEKKTPDLKSSSADIPIKETDWEKFCTVKNANRAIEDIKEIIGILENITTFDLSLSGSGLTIVSLNDN
jgi:hypothetical protein